MIYTAIFVKALDTIGILEKQTFTWNFTWLKIDDGITHPLKYFWLGAII